MTKRDLGFMEVKSPPLSKSIGSPKKKEEHSQKLDNKIKM
jgi:hypothetical protein